MNVIFDNIIFALQRSGGISTVWYELLKRAIGDTSFSKYYINYPNQNIFSQQLELPADHSLLANPRPYVERYLSPKVPNKFDSALFHSSYCRILPQKGIKNITTLHDFTYTFYRSGLPKAVHLWQERYAISHSDGLICVSEHTKKDLLKLYPKVDKNKIAVIHNGVDERFCPLDDLSDLTKLVPFHAGEYLLYVGNRYAAYKNFNVAVAVAKQTKTPLVVAGTQLSSEETVFLKENLGEENFKALADVNIEKLNMLYNGALCLLYPSLYEGFGIPILEAQRAHCPVVCLAVASIPEVAGDGALMLDVTSERKIAEAISATISDLQNGHINIADLRLRGKQNSLQFSWGITYQKTIDFYNKIEKS